MRIQAIFNRDGGTFRTTDMEAYARHAEKVFAEAGHHLDCDIVEGGDIEMPLTRCAERTDLDAVQRERLAAAHRQTVVLGALVDRLYEYAYLLDVEPRQELERLDVGLLVGEVLLGMSGEIKGAGLEVELDPPTGLVLATDREMLTRIVQNLGRNAVQHGRGTLAVEVAAWGGAEDGAELRFRNGVSPGAEIDTSRLFARFFTADASRSGRTSGLGLSIVQVLVAGLGGTVSAVHDPVAATLEIRVRIPPADPSAPR